MLKHEYTILNYIPFTLDWVEESDQDDEEENGQEGHDDREDAGLVVMAKNIYRKHGWPNLSTFNKTDCQKALEAMVKRICPDDAWHYGS